MLEEVADAGQGSNVDIEVVNDHPETQVVPYADCPVVVVPSMF